MSADRQPASTREVTLLQHPALDTDADALLRDITRYHAHLLGRDTLRESSTSLYQAVVLAVRDRLVERQLATRRAVERSGARQAYYLSLEYLTGRLLHNTLLNLGLEPALKEALGQLGLDLATVCESEHDTGLGNGGLGRLAACFLDSAATLGLPLTGYGLRYRYGMFRQRLVDGHQEEQPDGWLREGFPWEIKRFDEAVTVRFGGRQVQYTDETGAHRYRWVDSEAVLAIPYDVPVPGYDNGQVNTLRLWSAAATDGFNLGEFNAGSYERAVKAKNAADTLTMVLYPNDATAEGQALRLRQQYFLVSATLQDVLRQWVARHGPHFADFAASNLFQLNDTHPALAIPELMRLLMDEYRLDWQRAWAITHACMAYTNHTLLPEALEQWPVGLFEHLVPRLLNIIREIDHQLGVELANRGAGDRAGALAIITGDHDQRVHMARLAVTGSHSVNGVAAIHSQLLVDGLFRDAANLWPERFNNKTNGVTQRRWLAACNPRLAELISQHIGSGWTTDLEQLRGLAELADDRGFQDAWAAVRTANKHALVRDLTKRTGVQLGTDMLLDVQVKRIHEYKRQLLNLLHTLHLYARIRRGDTAGMVPRTVLIGGKAAPGYAMAKRIIAAINATAEVLNADPQTDGLLRLVFYPDYNVSAMERICPATDLSAQLSTASTEASGTGNMKFMLNGALTMGTLDGANVEILEAVGAEHFFRFGLDTDGVASTRAGYRPEALLNSNVELAEVVDMLRPDGLVGRSDPELFAPLVYAITDPREPWLTLADLPSLISAQREAAAAFADRPRWLRSSILNSAASGRFSSDRTIAEYNRDIWKLAPLTGTGP